MPDNINNDYNELAKLIYPSIEASGNVYYGQTRKLAIDELFNINDGGFESSIKTIRRQTDSNEDGFEYISYFCWKFGPLNGRIRIVPCDNDKFIFTFANFPELEKIYHLDDTYITNDNTDPIVGTLFIRYKLLLNDSTVEHILNSGTFNSYEKIISLDANDIRVYITDNCDPTNIDNKDIDDRNIFVKHENDAYYLFVKLCKCADVEYPGDALYFTNVNDGESTVKLIVNGELQTDYEYYKSSIDQWEKYIIGDVITLTNRNDKVYFRGSRSQQSINNYIQFNLTGKLSAGGNINSLLSPDESVYKNIDDYTTFESANADTFWGLFYDQSALVDASLLKLNTNKLTSNCYNIMFSYCTSLIQAPELPATTLADGCYYAMFSDCTSLTQAPVLPVATLAGGCYNRMFSYCTSLIQAPELPATTLADHCYSRMFIHCTNRINVPELPATTLADGCYYSMFEGCANLIQAPELPATTLADNCYSRMFSGCTNISDAPELPATTLVRHCYSYMFSGCTLLSYIKCLATDTSAEYCTAGWLANTASIGTFECDNKKYFTLDSTNGIPTGWTVKEINPDPDPGTFDPTIPFYIENVGDARAFVSLNTNNAKVQISYNNTDWSTYTLPTGGSTVGDIALDPKAKVYIKADFKDGAIRFNFRDEKYGQDLIKLSAGGNIASLLYNNGNEYLTKYTNTEVSCYQYMFSGCTSLTKAPELPATILNDSCYDGMFEDCTSLTQPPALPATDVANACYSGMFRRCTGLIQAPDLPAKILAQNCYSEMFNGCTNLTQAPKVFSSTDLASGCCMSMFKNCVSLIQAPELSAMVLAQLCYANMFTGCSKLNYVKCHAIDISALVCTSNWLSGVSATGDFYTPASTTWASSADGIPTGWTRHDI